MQFHLLMALLTLLWGQLPLGITLDQCADQAHIPRSLISIDNAGLLQLEGQTLSMESSLTYVKWAQDNSSLTSLNQEMLLVFCTDRLTRVNTSPLNLSESNFGAVSISSSGRYFAGGSLYNQRLTVVDFQTGEIQETSLKYLLAVAFSPDETQIAVGGGDGIIRVLDRQTLTILTEITEINGMTDNAVNVLAYSPDGRWLISGNQNYGPHIWDTRAMDTPSIVLEGASVYDLDISQNGILATSLWAGESDWLAAGVWKYEENELGGDWILLSEIRHEEDFYADIAISPDGSVVVLSSSDGTLLGYNAQDGQLLFEIPYTDSIDPVITDLSFSPDGTRIALTVQGQISIFSIPESD